MLLFLCAFALSAGLTLLVIRSNQAQQNGTRGQARDSPQRFHANAASRLGGIAVVVALSGTLGLWVSASPALAGTGALLVACGLPAFAAGFAEDLTHRVAPAPRLLATAVSALLATLLLGATINRTHLWGLDWIASFTVGSVVLSVFTATGIAHAINIIDGFNGLASMCAVMMMLALTYVAYQVGDATLAGLALVGAGAALGFFCWNFPAGLIFLGDGGAYFLGFYVAELGILLVQRNPTVSPLFPLLLCMYPIFETLFSIYRKRLLKGMSPGMPDGVHLHMLVYRRVLRWGVGRSTAKSLTQRNSMTSPFLWLLCMLAVVPSVLFWDRSWVLGTFVVAFGLVYLALYWRIVRFKTPDWMILRR